MLDKQYAGPMRTYETKCLQLVMLPRTLEEEAKALVTWAYPVFNVVGTMVYLTQKVCSRVAELPQKPVGATWTHG